MLNYLTGFGNHFRTEAKPGALPQGSNSPQQVPFGLYAEQINGSPFTAPRQQNYHTWLYRIHPSVMHGDFKPYKMASQFASAPFNGRCPPNQLRWNPLQIPQTPTDFIDGLFTFAGNGCTTSCIGGSIHIYTINKSMHSFFYNADGEMLFVPQHGKLLIRTEFGDIELEPLEIAVIPRGIKFQVMVLSDTAYGYICENYGLPLVLPELGPIGSNGLANPGDFLFPVAQFEHTTTSSELICKFEGKLWSAEVGHSPLDVVAWHGNYAPYKYDLRRFNTIGSISYDHPDPSIFSVLTSPTAIAGTANIDFVIFPPRWVVAENTFRPPWYHRNIMSEFMGLITGQYDAKPNGFVPGGASLHNRMSAHGPDANAATKAIKQALKPQYLANTMAFMFESSLVWKPTEFALNSPSRQTDYLTCWQDIPILFK